VLPCEPTSNHHEREKMNTEHEIVYVALNKLIESPHNVRKTRTNEGMQELQASILVLICVEI
jgi:hypothetical protein